jgi:membrane fusion protein (multidrug efflux system)
VSQQEVDNARQDNEANKAAVKAAQASVELATLQLGYTDVIAPIDGIAGVSNAQIGDLVGGPAGPVLTTISTLDPIRVYFPISEQEYLQFAEGYEKPDAKTGQKKRPELDLLLSDGSTYPRKGVVDFVNRQVGTTTGTIQIGATFPNPGNILRPGQYARVRAVTKMKTGALLVPQRAIVEVQGFRQVAVVGPDSKVSFRTVTTGERIGSDWIIDKGLKADERVVVEGLQKIRDGATVTTRLYDPAAKPAPSASPAESTPPAEAHKKD